MTNLAFTIWILGWWPACAVEDYLAHKIGRRYSEDVTRWGNLLRLLIWIVVAVLLHE